MTSPTGIRLGYVRVSTGRQDESLQHDALDGAKVLRRNRYSDHGVSGTKTSRPGLDALLADAKAEREAGHEVVVVTYRLDRLGRSTLHIAQLLADLTEQGIYIESIADGLNSATPMGRAMLQMASIFAELERNLIAERTVAGLAAAKAQGRVGGRPKATDTKQARQAQALRDAGESVPDIARALGVSAATVYRITKTPTRPALDTKAEAVSSEEYLRSVTEGDLPTS
ncbi:recombinase family protein [Microbacterium enclense]|uniref:recombinase family protein n=1 Tax=Microbacterium enclense TaxID=993073 RepID=UPI0021A90BE0|nr:recombinase family protein [Microbacterium enclense]MCT2084887.1 recombinase family protein [Microbacterium enclense]